MPYDLSNPAEYQACWTTFLDAHPAYRADVRLLDDKLYVRSTVMVEFFEWGQREGRLTSFQAQRCITLMQHLEHAAHNQRQTQAGDTDR
jgi:hypothetical protein